MNENRIVNSICYKKYYWLEKQRATEDIIKKIGNDYECPICCQNIENKNIIHITKCNHTFHYKCIEKAIDKNILDCPICRCNLRTGQKKIVENRNNNIYDRLNYYNDNYIDNRLFFILIKVFLMILRLEFIIIYTIINICKITIKFLLKKFLALIKITYKIIFYSIFIIMIIKFFQYIFNI